MASAWLESLCLGFSHSSSGAGHCEDPSHGSGLEPGNGGYTLAVRYPYSSGLLLCHATFCQPSTRRQKLYSSANSMLYGRR